jgi:hypothetical protein
MTVHLPLETLDKNVNIYINAKSCVQIGRLNFSVEF